MTRPYEPKEPSDHTCFTWKFIKAAVRVAQEDACACEVAQACVTCGAFRDFMFAMRSGCSPRSS
jgi:hypothetical protein